MDFDILKKLEGARVAVIGDIMIDVYVTGSVSRISPEAPVPVVRGLSQRSVPGGAANVAANIASVGASVSLVGVVGEDGGFGELCSELKKFGMNEFSGLIVDGSRRTIRKKRILAQQQQVVRVDYEDTHPFSKEVEAALVARSRDAIRACDIVVLSDYGKGAISLPALDEIISFANSIGTPTIVDPKKRNLSAYRGATIITPNRAELSLATGLPCESDDETAIAIEKAQLDFGGDILLTRSEKGMTFYSRSGPPLHFPTVAREVFDVSGAGDTVVGILASMLATGAVLADAIKVANHAAGIVVQKAGTATLTYDELLASLSIDDHHSSADGQLADWKIASALRRQWRNQGLSVGFANGCFDLLHPGHISLIRQAAAACDRLIVALNSDASVRRLKGATRPVQKEKARAEVIGAIKGVDLVVLFDQDTPLELIKTLEPDVLIKGSDYLVEQVVGADVVIGRGGSVILAQLVEGQSTTRLLQAN